MPSESTRQLLILYSEMVGKYHDIPQAAKSTTYAKAVKRIIAHLQKECEISEQLDEAKSYARCY